MKKNLLSLSLILLPVVSAFSQTWTTQTSGTSNELWGISFVDPVNGWSCGASGTMIHTTDGGLNWSPQTSGISSGILRNMQMYDVNNGWAVGDNGVIIHTTDGGANWNPQTSGVSVTLRNPSFVSSTLGWVCGASGTILHTTDGGASWNPQTSGTTIGLMSIHFVDATNGWAVGSSGGTTQGIILHTSDGGANWAPQTAPNNSNLNAVYFVDANHGWAAGNTGTIFATTDGGVNWATQTNPSALNVRGLFGADINNCWIVGDNGSIENTSDGGTNWGTQTSNTTQILRSTNFVNATRGYAVGVAGTILFYNLPAVTGNSSMVSFVTTVGTPSAPQTISVSGINLSANLDVTAPPDFEVSLSAVSGFGPMVSIPPVNTVVSSTTVYVRYNPSVAGTNSSTVDVSSNGATTVSIPVDGTSGNLGLSGTAHNQNMVYPNPSNGDFTLTNENNAFDQFTILDYAGRTVYSGTLNSGSTTIHTGLSEGTYIIQLSGNNASEVGHLVIH